MEWKKGPLPKNTHGFGGVVPFDADPAMGFFFAEFLGDTVRMQPDGRVLKAHEVSQYNNAIQTLPAKD
jgi:hypothetical protein